MVSDPMGLQLFVVVSCCVELGIEFGPSGGVQGVLNTKPSLKFPLFGILKLDASCVRSHNVILKYILLEDIFILRYIDENSSWTL